MSPHTGLADRDQVAVSGVGLAPRHTVVVTQCAPTVGACRFDYLTARTDGTGAFARTVKVRRLISRPDASAIDCATTACRIVVTDQSDSTISLSAAITFDPGAPFSPAPTVTITPDTALPPATNVTVRGAGFARNALVAVSECVLGTPDRCVGLSLEMTDATGRLDAPARISRLPFNTTVDCATAHCVLQVVDASRGDVAGARLVFDPSVPVPTIELDPSGPLPYLGSRHGDACTTSHRGSPTRPPSATGEAGAIAEATGTADLAGDLQLRVAVRRVVDDLTEDGPYPIDCATLPVCILQVEPGNGNGLERLSVQLTFDPTTSPTVRVGSTTVRETDGPQFAQVPVTLNAQSTNPVSVHFTIYGFTARAGTDFVAAPGTLVIPPGTTRGAIVIVVLGDTHHERPETLLVVISDPVNATIADGDAVLTIHDDD